MSTGDGHGRELRPDIEFLQHSADLGANGGQSNEMSFGDLVGTETVDQRTEHESLAMCQPFEGGLGALSA